MAHDMKVRSNNSQFLKSLLLHILVLQARPLSIILVALLSMRIPTVRGNEHCAPFWKHPKLYPRDLVCTTYKVPSRLREGNLENVPWCWTTLWEMDGETAWQSCKFNVLPVNRNASFYNGHLERLWLNLRETFPNSSTYTSTEFLVTLNETNASIMSDVGSTKENCVAINIPEGSILLLSCHSNKLHPLCAEGSISVILKPDISKNGLCYSSEKGISNGLTADPFIGCFNIQGVEQRCSSGIGVMVLIVDGTDCTMLEEEREVWYNGLLNSPLMWGWVRPGPWSKRSAREYRMCMLCRISSHEVSSMELMLRLKKNSEGIFLESYPSERGLLEPKCLVDGKFILTANETRTFFASNTEPTLIWCSQLDFDGTLSISNRVLDVPVPYRLIIEESELEGAAHMGQKWILQNGSLVVVNMTTPGPTTPELDVNAGCARETLSSVCNSRFQPSKEYGQGSI